MFETKFPSYKRSFFAKLHGLDVRWYNSGNRPDFLFSRVSAFLCFVEYKILFWLENETRVFDLFVRPPLSKRGRKHA